MSDATPRDAAAVATVIRRALAQDENTPEQELLSVRLLLEMALPLLDQLAAGPQKTVIEPCRAPEPLTTPAQLGSHNAGAARKAGCSDEYDNAIEAKYGKGW
jgi:hypothetical protein